MPVHLLTFSGELAGDVGGTALGAELARRGEGATCILLDTSGPALPLLRQCNGRQARILVPLAPDMNSVITLASVEELFAQMASTPEAGLQPVYLLVGFDAAEALHLDVREALRQQLEERLLPFVIRRSSAVAEALAEGMTVIDFAPEAGVANDYMAVAQWLRSKPVENPLSRQGTLWE